MGPSRVQVQINVIIVHKLAFKLQWYRFHIIKWMFKHQTLRRKLQAVCSKEAVWKFFANFTGKRIYLCFFFNKVTGQQKSNPSLLLDSRFKKIWINISASLELILINILQRINNISEFCLGNIKDQSWDLFYLTYFHIISFL